MPFFAVRAGRVLAAATLCGAVAGCALLRPARDPEPTPPAPAPVERVTDTGFARGAALLAEGSFLAADVALRRAASRCDSGPDGLRAVLLLASLHQDPRNPAAVPDTAALMAARYLYRAGEDDAGRALAEGLYVMALDHGADPGLRPDPSAPGLVPRYGPCARRYAADEPPRLPILQADPYSMRVRELENRLDSLRSVHEASVARVQGLESELAGKKELEAELERIRRLLQATDTIRVPGGAGG